MTTTPAVAQFAPLSGSDWLRQGTSQPGTTSAWRPGDPVPPDAQALRPPRRGGQDADPSVMTGVAESAATVPVGVRRLDAANADGAGVISARQAGLPDGFWQGTDLDTAIRMIRIDPALPASAQISRRVIEAQLPPPDTPADRMGEFFTARVDRLIADGALPSARSLLLAAGPGNSQNFTRLFDISLLMGGEQEICARMAAEPGISRDPAARIFCLAQAGDWPAAALLYDGAQRLGRIDPAMAELLAHYLDDAAVDEAEILPPPDEMTPLIFRLHEAIGQPQPTTELELRYAWSDLSPRAGWKAQLEAGERLARARALPAHTLHQLYSAQRPAASGSVWERAAAVQALDAALTTGDAAQIGPALTTAFSRMEAVGLRDSFAEMFARRLQPEILTGDAARLALWLRLWIGETDAVALPQEPLDAALLALATGQQPEVHSPALGALAPVFATELPPQPDPGDGIALAPALFGALADADAGVQGDVTRAARGVLTLRQLGLIAEARRVATQIALDPLLRDAAQ